MDQPIIRPLIDLCDPERGITYGIVKVGEFVRDGVPVVRGGDIRDGRVQFDDTKRVSEEVSNQFRRTILRGGELVINLIAEPGHCAIVPVELIGANVSRDVAVIALGNQVDHRFVDYVLKSPQAIEWLNARLNGSVTQKINLGTLRELPVPCPPIEEQRAVSGLLGALDDKIALNRNMNETLEAMARATFKDWFIDFGPVNAKAEGHAPYLAPELWNLFPDRLNEEGRPDGWTAGFIEDLFVLQRGFDLPAEARSPGKYVVMAASGPNGLHDTFMVAGPGVTTGRSGVLGRVFYIHEDFWPLNTSLWIKEFKASSPLHAFFVLELLDFGSLNAGSAVPTLNRNHVHNLPTVVPPRAVVERFDELCLPLLRKKRDNEIQSDTLAATRDFLLPKLMSGEITLRNTEKMVGAVA